MQPSVNGDYRTLEDMEWGRVTPVAPMLDDHYVTDIEKVVFFQGNCRHKPFMTFHFKDGYTYRVPVEMTGSRC